MRSGANGSSDGTSARDLICCFMWSAWSSRVKDEETERERREEITEKRSWINE